MQALRKCCLYLAATLQITATCFAAPNFSDHRDIGFSVQGGKAIKITEVEDGNYYLQTLALRWSAPIPPLSSQKLVHTKLRLEPTFGHFYNHSEGVIAGLNTPLVAYIGSANFLLPFIGIGGGAIYSDFSHLSSKLNFNLFSLVGLEWQISAHSSLHFEYRFLHVSNGGLVDPNISINSNLLAIGFSWF